MNKNLKNLSVPNIVIEVLNSHIIFIGLDLYRFKLGSLMDVTDWVALFWNLYGFFCPAVLNSHILRKIRRIVDVFTLCHLFGFFGSNPHCQGLIFNITFKSLLNNRFVGVAALNEIINKTRVSMLAQHAFNRADRLKKVDLRAWSDLPQVLNTILPALSI